MNDVTKLVQNFEEFEHGNPCAETTANDLLAVDTRMLADDTMHTANDLLALDTRMLADHTMHQTVKAAHDIGIIQLQKFADERLKESVSNMILYLVINYHSLHLNHNPKSMILTD